MRAILRLLPLLALAPVLSGCGGNFLVGKWTFDREATLASFVPAEPNAASPGEGFLKEVVGGLQKGLSRLLLTQFEGIEIQFTASERRLVRNGTGKAQGYKIIERPAGGQLRVQYADGEIETWERHGKGVRMRLPGDEAVWVHFKSAP